MKFRRAAANMLIAAVAVIAVSAFTHCVEGCNVCTVRNGTDVRPRFRPSSGNAEGQENSSTPLTLTSAGGIVAVIGAAILVKKAVHTSRQIKKVIVRKLTSRLRDL